MADIGSTIKDVMPEISTSMTFNFITWLLVAVIFIVVIGAVAYLVIKRLKFNKKIIIWERINQNFEPTRKDWAMEMKLSLIGDTIFYLKGHKKYIPNPSFQVGRRTYHYFIREDGEWINFRFEDFDESSRTMGAKFLDKEMRFARTQIQKGLGDRYDKPGFWKQYGLLVVSIAFIVVVGMMFWLSLDKFIDIIGATANILDKLEPLLDRSDDILVSIDNVCTGGSGYIPA